MLNTIHGWGISARAHVHIALLYLRNGSTDCVKIWYVGWRSLSTCFPQVTGGVGHLCTCARAPPSPYLRIRVANCAKIWCVARDQIVTRFTRVGGGVTTFARACPVSLSRKPLSPGTEATPKTDLSLSRSLVHRQTWRLTGFILGHFRRIYLRFYPFLVKRCCEVSFAFVYENGAEKYTPTAGMGRGGEGWFPPSRVFVDNGKRKRFALQSLAHPFDHHLRTLRIFTACHFRSGHLQFRSSQGQTWQAVCLLCKWWTLRLPFEICGLWCLWLGI